MSLIDRIAWHLYAREDEINELRDALNDAKTAKDTALKVNTELVAERDDLQVRFDKVSQMLTVAKSDATMRKEESEAAHEANKKLDALLVKTQQERDSAVDTTNRMEDALKASAESYAELERTSEVYHTALVQHQDWLSEANSTIRKQADELVSVKKALKALQDADAQIADFKEALSAKQDALDSVAKEREAYKAQVIADAEAYAKLESALDAALTTAGEYEKERDDYKRQLDEQNSVVESLEALAQELDQKVKDSETKPTSKNGSKPRARRGTGTKAK